VEAVLAELALPSAADRADWLQVRALLLDAVGESQFEIWLASLELRAVDRGAALVVIGPAETASWVRDRFGRLLARAAERTGREVRFADERERAATGSGMPAAAGSDVCQRARNRRVS
jgi:hypothetical protein